MPRHGFKAWAHARLFGPFSARWRWVTALLAARFARSSAAAGRFKPGVLADTCRSNPVRPESDSRRGPADRRGWRLCPRQLNPGTSNFFAVGL